MITVSTPSPQNRGGSRVGAFVRLGRTAPLPSDRDALKKINGYLKRQSKYVSRLSSKLLTISKYKNVLLARS